MITLADVIDAIEKNGLTKIQGQYIKYDDTGMVPLAGCALGQAAINLGFVYPDGNPYWSDGRYPYTPDTLHGLLWNAGSFTSRVFELNDTTAYTLPEIAEVLRTEYEDFLNVVIKEDD